MRSFSTATTIYKFECSGCKCGYTGSTKFCRTCGKPVVKVKIAVKDKGFCHKFCCYCGNDVEASTNTSALSSYTFYAYCPNCDRTIHDSEIRHFDRPTCGKCGFYLSEFDKFCMGCGITLEEALKPRPPDIATKLAMVAFSTFVIGVLAYFGFMILFMIYRSIFWF